VSVTDYVRLKIFSSKKILPNAQCIWKNILSNRSTGFKQSETDHRSPIKHFYCGIHPRVLCDHRSPIRSPITDQSSV